jgi:hypothetical protein
MTKDNKPPKARPGDAPRGAAGEASEAPFDKWLRRQLHAMYDKIASEPLPEELIRLIESDSRKRQAPNAAGKKKATDGRCDC